MSKNENPCLCGGTFFTQLLNARKQRIGPRQKYNGESDGLSDPNALVALIKVCSPSYTEPTPLTFPTFKGNTSDFKNCKVSSGTYLPFGDTGEVRSFDECVRTNYGEALSRMLAFTDTFLDAEKDIKKDEYLAEALIELISEDSSIGSDALFYALENGTAVTKEALTASADICLQAFLVGVWHYILLQRPDNKIGRSTIENWMPSKGFTQKLNVYNYIEQAVPSEDAEESAPGYEETVIDDSADDRSDDRQQNTTQTVNNPVVFNQYGNNGIQIGSIGTLNIKHGD